MGSYVPNTEEDREEMLSEMGYSSVDDLFSSLPEEVRFREDLALSEGKSEFDVWMKFTKMADENTVFPVIFRGAGSYRHFIPSMLNNVLTKESIITAYTPYQAEVSQGVLQSIYEYQTMMCDLTGMDASNASVYDGATAAAEGIAMCRERKRKKALVSSAIQPGVLKTIGTYGYGNGMEIEVIPEKDGRTDEACLKERLDEETACVYIQHPNYYGNLEEASAIGEAAHAAGAKFVMGVNPITLGVLKSPREYGADVAVGDAQPLGMRTSFGGPTLGFMTCIQSMMRRLPGRIVGETTDEKGNTGFCLTLQAREQHIRREKASSNICSNEALCALAASVYLVTMGNKEMKKVGVLCMSKAHYLAKELEKAGFHLENTGDFFHEFVTVSKKSSSAVLQALEAHGILGGYPLDDHRILWCCTEVNSKEEMDEVVRILKEV